MKRNPRKLAEKPQVRHSRHGFITFEFVPQGKTLLSKFTRSVQAGAVPESWVLRDLATRFQQILDGEPADKALGLQAGQGKKRTVEKQLRDQHIAAEVEYLYSQRGRGSLEHAKSVVADRYNLSVDRVTNIYKADQRKRRSISRSTGKRAKK